MKTRRGFLRTILAAPVAAVVAAGLWKPEVTWARYQRLGVLKYKRFIGTMEITPAAMEKVYWMGGRGGGKTEMQRQLNQQMRRVLDEHREIVEAGLKETSPTYEIFSDSGVRKVGGAGAYPSEVTGA